jgi:hypothetical protein
VATTVTTAARRLAIRLPDGLSEVELRQLGWLHSTLAARTHLERQGLPPDLAACRHLAFGLWLRVSGRLDGEHWTSPGV